MNARLPHHSSREVLLEGAVVTYALQRSHRRSVGFTVAAGALSVRVPRWLPLADIDAAVLQKARWIVQKLQQSQAKVQQLQNAASAPWAWGRPLAFLGGSLLLAPMDAAELARLDPARSGPKAAAAPAALDSTGSRLLLALPEHMASSALQHAAQHWLQQQALLHFRQRLDFFAPQLGVAYRSLALSNARTRWGSASTSGAIRLNWRLIHLEPRTVDYVVVHELSHLRHMNHSAQFWATVASVLPDAPLLRRQLRMVVTNPGN